MKFFTAYLKGKKGVTVILDNHTAHHTKEVTDLISKKNHYLFLPSNSSALNPIENLWHVIKGKWAKLLLEKDIPEE